MKIAKINLYTISSGTGGARGAARGESQYWGGAFACAVIDQQPDQRERAMVPRR